MDEQHHLPLSPQRLKVIQGGAQAGFHFGMIHLIAAPESVRPFNIDARVFEEDTWLTISADPKTFTPEIPLIRLMQNLHTAKAESVGTVLVRGNNPLRFLAIVCDVDSDPICKAEWVEQALKAVLHEVEGRRIHSLGMPLLGTQHGKLTRDCFIGLLSQALIHAPLSPLQRLWLITPPEFQNETMTMLKQALHRPGSSAV